MKQLLAVLIVAATPALANPAQTALSIAPDQVECITETVYHDWGAETEEVKQFYRDAHISSLLAAYAGVQAGLYTQQNIEAAYSHTGCDWIRTLVLTQRATLAQYDIVPADRGTISLDFLNK